MECDIWNKKFGFINMSLVIDKTWFLRMLNKFDNTITINNGTNQAGTECIHNYICFLLSNFMMKWLKAIWVHKIKHKLCMVFKQYYCTACSLGRT